MRGGSTWMDENMSSTTISCVQGSGLVGGVLSPHHHRAAASPLGGGYIGERPLLHTSAPQSPAQGWHMHPVPTTVTVKQETMERDERMGNDSGISSAYTPGSDGFQSSSPGSSDHYSRDSEPSTAMAPTYPSPGHVESPPINFYNSTPVLGDSRYSSTGMYHPYTHPMNITTNYENHSQSSTNNNTLTPVSDETKSSPTYDRRTPGEHSESEESDQYYKNDGDESLQRLQMAIDRSDLHSPKGSEHNSLEDDKSDYEGEEDEASLRTPRVNSHGKVKIFKCKQCEFVAVTKLDFWEHTRGHIKAEKLLTCPKCPFVTEYKHHLEYHLRNHFGSKPFKCDKCNYSCVNKSMLNSHLKSHSNIYQYRCSDCAYATKYCHSLKLHLRKYNHKPAMVLNPDGSPNPLPIIDVYGTRRGPKQRNSSNQKTDKHEVPQPEPSPPTQNPQQLVPPHSIFPPSHFMLQPPNQSTMPLPMPFPFGQLLNAFQGNIPNPLVFPPNNNNNIEKPDLIANSQETEKPLPSPQNSTQCDQCDYTADNKDDLNAHMINSHEPLTPKMEIISDNEEMPDENAPEVLDLSRPDVAATPSGMETSVQTPTTPTATKNRRKGRAFKLGHVALQLQHATGSDDETEPSTPKAPKTEDSESEEEQTAGNVVPEPSNSVEEKKARARTPPTTVADGVPKKDLTFNCQYCDIVFKDVVMYTMHMGYHGYRDPFTCNMCGEQTEDKLAFFLHIARTSHC